MIVPKLKVLTVIDCPKITDTKLLIFQNCRCFASSIPWVTKALVLLSSQLETPKFKQHGQDEEAERRQAAHCCCLSESLEEVTVARASMS